MTRDLWSVLRSIGLAETFRRDGEGLDVWSGVAASLPMDPVSAELAAEWWWSVEACVDGLPWELKQLAIARDARAGVAWMLSGA